MAGLKFLAIVNGVCIVLVKTICKGVSVGHGSNLTF